ncbi:MAG: hypothetical protein JXR50_02130 [Prolixibacteraceae bacterium]|nr:hypothetical protein [Prolixibacteraceae bacterium]MBN2648516.1 hypothetical protein [Prolixibacteraceae bacterium]
MSFFVPFGNHIKIRSCFLIIIILIIASALEVHAQCDIDADDYYTTYLQTLNSFQGNIREVGKDIESHANNINILAGQLMLIPSGVSFYGSISSSAPDAVICIAEGGIFNPSSFNNVYGILRNYNTNNSLSISPQNCQIENYGGEVNITNNQSKSIFNFDNGIITTNSNLNIVSNNVYNEGTFTINGNLNGNEACIINNGEMNVNSSVSGSFDLTNNGQFTINDKMHGSGTLENQGWMTIGDYIASYSFINYGKVEILGTQLHFNPGGEVFNYCSFFSFTEGSSFQNNTNIYNYGLIYFPNGNWSNKQTFTNGEKGTVRTCDLTNENGIVTGSGKFYVVGSSENKNGHATFGLPGDAINFFDASNINNPGHFDKNKATIGDAVYYTEFPEPEYSPDLSLYECGDIILSEIDGGVIGYDQVVCQGMSVQPLVSISPAYMDGNPTIAYQWQYKFPGDEYFTDISGANTLEYDPDTATVNIQYRRKAFFTFPDNPIKDCSYGSNIVSIVISNETPPEITAHPTDTIVCPGSPASFYVTSNDDTNNQFQWMSKAGTEQEWSPINESEPYTGTTSKTLYISSTENLTSYQFACAVSSGVCGAIMSNSAQVVHFPDSIPILTAPENQYLCIEDNSAQFSVETESEYITFQWQESIDGGTTWNNIADGENYQGVNSKNLVVTGSALVNGNHYTCIATTENDCFEAQSAAAILYKVEPSVIVEPTASIKCPDTDPELNFNGIDSNYQMGNSVITFLVQRNTIGPFTWSFSYQLEVSNPELLVDSQSQGNIDISDTNTTLFPLAFYIENQTEEIVTATLSISNVEVAGCSESSDGNPNHTANMQVHKMPLVGEFKKD